MEANDPALRSFIDVSAGSDFPIQNLPFGIFSTASDHRKRAGVAIGEYVLDCAVLEDAGFLAAKPGIERFFNRPALNAFLALGRTASRRVRSRLSELLRFDNAELRENGELRARAFVPLAQATMHLPILPRGYTDFYSSKEHATNVGSMFRDPKNALLPNWTELPVAYNGRPSSVVVSGTPVRRPLGQTKAPEAPRPSFGPSRRLDIELETAFVVGTGNALGEPIPVAQAEEHIFGLVLMNDWSARDIQQWEYVPLGPFNAKTFGTSISPWIVMLDALEPFRVEGPAQDPQPLPYLQQAGPHAYDITFEVRLRPATADETTLIARSNFKYLYWSMAQQLAHHTISGCNTEPGDLMGSGTISGPEPQSRGSLLELTWNGKEPLQLRGGVTRTFLEDGDEVTITGWAERDGLRIGFGDVRGTIFPAPQTPH